MVKSWTTKHITKTIVLHPVLYQKGIWEKRARGVIYWPLGSASRAYKALTRTQIKGGQQNPRKLLSTWHFTLSVLLPHYTHSRIRDSPSSTLLNHFHYNRYPASWHSLCTPRVPVIPPFSWVSTAMAAKSGIHLCDTTVPSRRVHNQTSLARAPASIHRTTLHSRNSA